MLHSMIEGWFWLARMFCLRIDSPWASTLGSARYALAIW